MATGLVGVKDPQLREVRQVGQLKRNIYVSVNRFFFNFYRSAYRATERAKLPVENPDHAVFRRVEDEVVELVVAMHDPHARLALVGQVLLVPRDELVPPGYFTHRLAGVDVLHGRLRVRHLRQRPHLAREVRLVRAEFLQADLARVERR